MWGLFLLLNFVNDWTLHNIHKYWQIYNQYEVMKSYSLYYKGRNKDVKETKFSGSLNCLFSITSSESWFGFLTYGRINGQKFINNLDRLNKWLLNNDLFGEKK